MKLIVLIGILLIAACRTSAPPPDDEPPQVENAVSGPFETAERAVEGGFVERMHADGDAFVALVAGPGGSYQLLRLRQRDGEWVVVDSKPANEDYLWPAQ